MRHSFEIMENSCKCTTDTHSKTKIEYGSLSKKGEFVELHFHFNFLPSFQRKVKGNFLRLMNGEHSGSPRGNVHKCSF